MSKNADALIFATKRTDGAQIAPASALDLNTGCSYSPNDNAIVPSRPAVERLSSLGDSNAAARIVGDMVAGMPNVADNDVSPDFGPIEKLSDTRSQLPRREGSEP
jgi:hypothetical protein